MLAVDRFILCNKDVVLVEMGNKWQVPNVKDVCFVRLPSFNAFGVT